MVPAYFYAGGVAGAASVLGAAAQALEGDSMRRLVTRCRWIAAGGTAAGTALLVWDLGRPGRFLNMLRVMRPTSPMSVGSWILAPASALSAGAAALGGADGALRRLGDAAGYGAGALGAPLTAYSAVLVSNTAVPLWQEVRRSLPALFAASAMAGAASLLELGDLSPGEERVVRRFGRLGTVAELAATVAVEREASRVPRVGKPLEESLGGALWTLAKACAAGSLVLSVVSGRRRGLRTAGALLGAAAGLAARFAVFRAGIASARDPRATFEHQRAGRGAAELNVR